MSAKPVQLSNRADIEIVTLPEVLYQLRAEVDDIEDPNAESVFRLNIDSAIEWLESYTGQIGIAADATIYFDSFSPKLFLPVYPVNSLISVSYRDSSGATESLDLSQVDSDLKSLRPYITAPDGWPETDGKLNAVEVVVRAGYESPESIPANFKTALLMLTTHLYENPSATTMASFSTLPMGVKCFANTAKVSWL